MDRDDTLTTQTPTLITTEESERLFSRFVKPADLPRFYGYQERNQERVRQLIVLMEVIAKAPNLSLGYTRASLACAGAFSADTLRGLYRKWRKCRNDWRELIDNALEQKQPGAMPQEFIDEVQLRCDANARSIAAALKMLRADWMSNKPIPGYGTWGEWWMRTHPGRKVPRHCSTYPDGWSTRNLRRKLDESKARRIAQIRGLSAARKHLPHVKLSRVGSAPGRELMWDDKEHDYFVNSFDHQQGVRPIELYCHDYFAAYKTFFGLKPKYKDDEGFVKKLTGDMMRMVVAGHYWTHGYHPDGTVNYAEHGTANFAEEVKRALYDDTHGLVTVQESGFQGRAPHAGLYHGRWRGNPGFKASLESSNNNDHNWLAAVPGQTGRNVEERPENLHGMLTHNAQLLEAWQWLPAEFRDMLDFPLMEITQFRAKLNEVYHYIACERDHDLEGWLECSHVTQAIEFGGHVLTLDDIKGRSASDREKAMAMISAGILQTKPVRMNRAEVWHRGKSALVPIHGGTVCRILGNSFAREAKVQGHEIVVHDAAHSPEPLYYFGSVVTPENVREELREGGSYEVFINPFAPAELFVRDAKRRFLGVAMRQPKAARLNTDAVTAAVKTYATEENRVLSKLARRQLPNIAKRRDRHKHNASVIKKATAAQQDFERRATRQATEALDATLVNSDTHNHHAINHTNEIDPRNLW